MTAAPTIRIRSATVDDRDLIVSFNSRLAEETEGLRLDSVLLSAGVDAVLTDESKGRYLLAEVDGVTVGQLLLTEEWSDWRNGRYLWIQSVYVRQDKRRQGVFRALFDGARKLALASDVCGLRLYVHDENTDARATYACLGLVSHGYLVLETPDKLRSDRV